MKTVRWITVCAVALLAGQMLSPGVALAQDAEGTRAPIENTRLISANPFLLLATWFNADFEHKVSNKSTLGAQLSWATSDLDDDGNDDEDERYRSLNAVWRYYPQGSPLVGVFFGPKAGYYRVDDGEEEGNAWGLGFEMGYNWMLGAERNFAISVGIGATRLWGDDIDGGAATIPTVRLVNIGWAF